MVFCFTKYSWILNRVQDDSIEPPNIVMPDSIRHPYKKSDKMDKEFYVYILASKKNGTIYISVTSHLIKRVWEHKNNLVEGFSKKYNVHLLVYFEKHELIESAINREKKLKNWKRKWKTDLIEKTIICGMIYIKIYFLDPESSSG